MTRIITPVSVRMVGTSLRHMVEPVDLAPTTDGTPQSSEASGRQPQGAPAGSLHGFLGEYEDVYDDPLWPGSFRSPAYSSTCSMVKDSADSNVWRIVARTFKKRTSLSRGVF